MTDELVEKLDIKQLTKEFIEFVVLKNKHSDELLIDLVNDLPEFPSFADQDPLKLQQALRDEWR